jgi:simple sugar transport system permease protein
MKWPFTFERAGQPSGWRVIFVSLAALLGSFISTGILFQLYGLDPVETLHLVLTRTLGTSHGWSEAIRRATPVLLIGLGMLASSRARYWNIGADGQMLMAAVGATGVARFVPLPGPMLLPGMFAAGIVGAALWALLPGLLKIKFGVNEIITGLMANQIAMNIVDWLIQGPWRGLSTHGFSYTDTFPRDTWLPLIPGTRICWLTALFGILLAVALHVFLFHTRQGFRIRVLGENPAAARYAGMNPIRILAGVSLIAGGFAGIAGVGEVAGVHHKLLAPQQITVGYGITAVIVSVLARGKPLWTLVTSLVLGIILATSDVMTVVLHLPMAMTGIFTGLILYFLICGDFLVHYRLRLRRTETEDPP